jgi:cell division septation protein DedD
MRASRTLLPVVVLAAWLSACGSLPENAAVAGSGETVPGSALGEPTRRPELADVVLIAIAPLPGEAAAPPRTPEAASLAHVPLPPDPEPIASAPLFFAAPVAPAQPGAQQPQHAIYVQVASYALESQARALAQKLSSLNPDIVRGSKDGRIFYRVRLGPLVDRSAASAALGRVHELGFRDGFIVNALPPELQPIRRD